MYQNMVITAQAISGPGYENMAGFRPGPGPDMISGATLNSTRYLFRFGVTAIRV